MQHLFIIIFQQGQLEAVFRRIKCDSARAGRTIKTVHGFTFDTREVDWIVESTDDTMITIRCTFSETN